LIDQKTLAPACPGLFRAGIIRTKGWGHLAGHAGGICFRHLIAPLRIPAGLTGWLRNAALRYRSALVSEFAMDAVVDRILNTYQLMRPLDPDRVSDSKRKVTRYIESLASAGQSDAQKLAVYGLAYLKELHEGRDPRFTGC
jgi:hypothetical protein